MTTFLGLRAETYIKKAKKIKKCVIKRKIESENYKNSLEATQLENKIKYLKND